MALFCGPIEKAPYHFITFVPEVVSGYALRLRCCLEFYVQGVPTGKHSRFAATACLWSGAFRLPSVGASHPLRGLPAPSRSNTPGS